MGEGTEMFTHAQLVGILLSCAGVIIIGLAGLVVSMIKSFSKAVTVQMTEGFKQVVERQGVLEAKFDDMRRELDSKIDGVRDSVNELDKRLYAIERDHERFTQNGTCRYGGDGGN